MMEISISKLFSMAATNHKRLLRVFLLKKKNFKCIYFEREGVSECGRERGVEREEGERESQAGFILPAQGLTWGSSSQTMRA